MTQPHMVRSRPYRYFSLQIGSLQGLAATRKCILALRAIEGAGQGRHSPAQPHATREARGSRGRCGDSTRPSLPPPPLPRGARHVGRRELQRAWPRSPGWPRLGRAPPRPRSRPALYSAPRLQLPPGPCAGHRCRPRPARSGAGRPQGALAFPDPRSGRPCRLRVRAETVLCAGTCRGVFAMRSQVFLHIFFFKKMSFYCLYVAGAILKALPWVGSPA